MAGRVDPLRKDLSCLKISFKDSDLTFRAHPSTSQSSLNPNKGFLQMIARSVREQVKRIPFVGPLIYNFYLKLFYDEGKVEIISGGILKGKSWIRFLRTTFPECLTGNYEASVQAALAKHLKDGMVFYDVGANSGFFSLLGSTLVGPTGRVVAFEPHPITAVQLKAQMQINRASNVDVVVAAVSDKCGTAQFSDDLSADMLSLIGADQSMRSITVRTTTIDKEANERPEPDVLKLDVEGAEIDALKGAEQFIRTKKPVLLVEVHSAEIAVQYDRLMTEFGYQTHDLSGKSILVAQSGERFVVSTPKAN